MRNKGQEEIKEKEEGKKVFKQGYFLVNDVFFSYFI